MCVLRLPFSLKLFKQFAKGQAKGLVPNYIKDDQLNRKINYVCSLMNNKSLLVCKPLFTPWSSADILLINNVSLFMDFKQVFL